MIKQLLKIGKWALIGVVFLTFVLAWLFLGYCLIESYSYKYLYIPNWFSFIMHTVFSLVVPGVTVVLSVVLMKQQKMKTAFVWIAISVFAFVLSFLLCGAGIFSGPPVCSYTENPKNFGKYDVAPGESFSINPVAVFPERVPQTAQDVQYCYYFHRESKDILYVAVGWEAEDAELTETIRKLEQEGLIRASASQEVYRFTDSYYKNAVVFDFTAGRIYFVVTSENSLLPNNAEEAIKSAAQLQDR